MTSTLPQVGGTTGRTTREGRRRGGSWAGPAFAAPQAIGLAVFMAIPVAMTFIMGTFRWPMLGDRQFTGLDNLTSLFADPIFRTALWNTASFTVLYLIGNLVVSLSLAVWMGPRMPFRQFFRVLFFIPVVTPVVANAVVWKLVYQPRGVVHSTLESIFGAGVPDFLNDPNFAMLAVVVMSVWQGFGYNMLIFSAALDAIPESHVEAALIDRAGPLRVFWHIKLPAITPSLFYCVTMTLITSMQVFAQTFIMTKGGPGSSTLTVVQFIYNQGFTYQNLGLAAAAGTILFVIILMVTAVQFLGEKKWVNYD